MKSGGCEIPSPYNSSMPGACAPLTNCAGVASPAFPFPLIPTCISSLLDSYLGVCVCLPGQYIAQVYPKICLPCPSHLHSPDGVSCVRCPALAVPTMDGTGCRCVEGTQDVDVSSEALQCVCGAGNGFSTAGCVPCPVNTAASGELVLGSSPWLQSKQCVQCPAGKHAGVGQAVCEACPMWQYRETGMQT